MANNAGNIVCTGEILWDGLPDGLFLGGAPLNVCLNLRQLGVDSTIVSRVGQDRLGEEALSRIQQKGVDRAYIQRDQTNETGFVKVSIGEEEEPEYQFVQPVAWDFINIHQPETEELLINAWAVVFGTLAHRSNPGLKEILDFDGFKILDMNLRSPHYERKLVLELVEGSDIIKMNEDELELLQQWCSFSSNKEESIRRMASQFNCKTICVTQGKHGALLLHHDQYFVHPGYKINAVDAVGAGDAFLAALLYGLKSGEAENKLLPFANAAGAVVASEAGANPSYSVASIESVMNEEK